jgi:hypothetical protein
MIREFLMSNFKLHNREDSIVSGRSKSNLARHGSFAGSSELAYGDQDSFIDADRDSAFRSPYDHEIRT